MKKITYSCFLFCLLISFSFCKIKQYTPADYPKQQISFGNGGGITGLVNETFILENGKMFSKSGLDTNYVALKTLSSQVVSQVFHNVEILKLKEVKMNQPANTYNFIRIKDKEVDHQIVWSGQATVPKEVSKFYGILKHLAKTK